ncbi:unnamed protein product [Ectocarpus sp. CCAP 1310/34]|nr:unnamed protein product [Ectocarpus sp. CCAP 1310/34]
MYRVRDGHHAFVPDRYVVHYCFPNTDGRRVDPGKIFQTLKLVGAHAVPPGLVPRLLAWCGRGEGRYKECCKRGLLLEIKKHLVLLIELRSTHGASWIECDMRGNLFDESPGKVLKDKDVQIHELFSDNKYGFPGLGLSYDEVSETDFDLDGDDKALVERIKSILRDQTNVRWPILACVLPTPESDVKPLEEINRSFEGWSTVLRSCCRDGKKQRKGFATRKLWMFFLCPVDRSLAECGPGGQGCEVDFEATPGTRPGGAFSTLVEESLDSGGEALASSAEERLDGGWPKGPLQHGAQQVKHL